MSALSYPQNEKLRKILLLSKDVNTLYLYDTLPSNNGRHAQWLQNSIKHVEKLNEYLALRGYPKIDTKLWNSHKIAYYVSVECALAMLYVGVNYQMHVAEFINLQEVSGVNLPNIEIIDDFLNQKRSRNELKFAKKLMAAINKDTGTKYYVETQKVFGNYRVDFYITQYFKHTGTVVNEFIIEYDEKYHNGAMQTDLDTQRDRYIKENFGIDVIRVKSENEDEWFRLFEDGHPYFNKSNYDLSFLDVLIKEAKKLKLDYLNSKLINDFILYWKAPPYFDKETKFPLKLVTTLLDRYKLPYKISKRNRGTERVIVFNSETESLITEKLIEC